MLSSFFFLLGEQGCSRTPQVLIPPWKARVRLLLCQIELSQFYHPFQENVSERKHCFMDHLMDTRPLSPTNWSGGVPSAFSMHLWWEQLPVLLLGTRPLAPLVFTLQLFRYSLLTIGNSWVWLDKGRSDTDLKTAAKRHTDYWSGD